MYALDSPPAGLPFTTRSSLQALLKSRGAVAKRNKWILPKDNLTANGLSVAEDSVEIQVQQNDSQVVELNLQNGDQNGDFSYSQKLFHIDDGNLYSIFSPLQGRSYGMKPSFLRKQKCTVQECHGRGRKVLRKGLKFHNFLPSESVTSEKDNNIREDQWKVHSECKLREEHGTKQIMVSNWFQNVKHVREDGAGSSSHSSESVASSDSVAGSSGTAKAANFSLGISSESASPVQDESNLKVSNSKALEMGKKFSVLNSLLHSVAKSQTSNTGIPSHKLCKPINTVSTTPKRRRKPDLTRRVVPYTKYLSLMEENESFPLDLSLHTSSSNDLKQNKTCDQKEGNSEQNVATRLQVDNSDTVFNKPKFALGHVSENASSVNPGPNFPYPMFPILTACIQPQFKTTNDGTFQNVNSQNLFHQSQSSPLKKALASHGASATNYHSSTPRNKTRRKSQRSVIKQKLEDTFRQNGFLVKTKQVSDGDATFCKFRQLRKYTRYYLKSWQQHLPDEVHKMWKGFLPPKTVLPPTAVQPNTNENPV